MITGFKYRLNSLNEFLIRGEMLKKENKIHPFIINEITSLFSYDIENGYYTPYLNLQNIFQTSSGFESIRINNSNN